MKIIITGGAGFIGSSIAEKYISLGQKVVIIDNLVTGKESNIPKEARFYKIDIRDKERVREVFLKEKPEVVSHHAAQLDVRKSVADPGYDASVNILGLLNVLESAVESKARKVIYISSGGVVYGEGAKLPIPESAAKQPLSPYGVAKYAGEMYVRFFNRIKNLDYTIFRYSNVYGPKQDPNGEAGVIAIFSELLSKGTQPKIFGDGEQTRDYVFIGDVVEANVLALEKGEGQTFNIGTGKETTVNELFSILKREFGYLGQALYEPARPGELLRNCLDISKAKQVLGWQPKTSLLEGVKITKEWLKSL